MPCPLLLFLTQLVIGKQMTDWPPEQSKSSLISAWPLEQNISNCQWLVCGPSDQQLSVAGL